MKSAKESKETALTKIKGADLVNKLLIFEGIDTAFAYPGTSELALCNSIVKSRSIKLYNGRGDKECVFLAAGRSIFEHAKGVAIVHGARGLTNAIGAVADVKRNEISMLCIVGLPSTTSAKYLPPHGETDLLRQLGSFSKEVINLDNTDILDISSAISKIRRALKSMKSEPYGPVLLGIPQNFSEGSFVMDLKSLKQENKFTEFEHFSAGCDYTDRNKVIEACELIKSKKNIIIIIDDFYLKRNTTSLLDKFAERINARVFQLEYRRGPVFFEQIDTQTSGRIVGYFNPASIEHQRLLQECDLLITIEDRNMYPRNIGNLPSTEKIVITSNPAMTIKNDYFRQGDILLNGNVSLIIEEIIKFFSEARLNETDSVQSTFISEKIDDITGMPFLRNGFVKTLSESIGKFRKVAWVDDGQIFGSILKENYKFLPRGIRVFGDHAGFVGSGLGYASGLASSTNFDLIVCTLGDHGFCNGFQSLFSWKAIQTKLLVIVLNNGKSVSLETQSLHNGYNEIVNSGFLKNIDSLNYRKMAESLGVESISVDLRSDIVKQDEINQTLDSALSRSQVILLEIKASQALETYFNLWACKGLDEK